jgi:hypothetical protein
MISELLTSLDPKSGLSPKRLLNYKESRAVGDGDFLILPFAAPLRPAGVEFIDENGGGPGVRLGKPRHQLSKK